MAGQTTARRGGDGVSPSGPPPGEPERRRPWWRARPRLRPDRLVFGVLGLALLAAGVFWLLHGSPWVRVERVTVGGTEVLTEKQVRRAAAVQLGTPLATVDASAVAARVRAELPRAGVVEVARSWPHEITIAVTERKAAVLIEKGGTFIEVDRSGVRFATVEKRPKDVPLLDVDVSGSPSLHRFGTERLRREAAGLADALPPEVRRSTRALVVRSYDSVTLRLTGGRTVVWGSPEDTGRKARTLRALLKAAPRAGHFDVSAPTAPAVARS
ncbi:cell division protein FtsQ/DivIB [Streptomyces zingiberis]|uniref:Cell division protein FtsQ n=1 Tax=Streptomyces zingiberis TaxID=2053010 RepID=A0ABX1C1E6_9ACTN|nr:FtsQ-type POTRA domain-containing protein [Streptomyces zingiberis]NJQ02403.1 FtsQ-type POTRA domain-containing protein [Streptomyces zingiberis]